MNNCFHLATSAPRHRTRHSNSGWKVEGRSAWLHIEKFQWGRYAAWAVSDLPPFASVPTWLGSASRSPPGKRAPRFLRCQLFPSVGQYLNQSGPLERRDPRCAKRHGWNWGWRTEDTELSQKSDLFAKRQRHRIGGLLLLRIKCIKASGRTEETNASTKSCGNKTCPSTLNWFLRESKRPDIS